jgi:hypothetical protein
MAHAEYNYQPPAPVEPVGRQLLGGLQLAAAFNRNMTKLNSRLHT